MEESGIDLFETSSELSELFKALAAAQGSFENAKKNGKGNFGKFADLAEILNTCREPLAKNGLSVAQFPIGNTACGTVTLLTRLMHASGQWMQSVYTVKSAKPDAQGAGGAITYARRYALAAILGIAQEDDDGETAVGRGALPQKPAGAPAGAAQPPAGVPPQGQGKPPASTARSAQAAHPPRVDLFNRLTERHVDPDAFVKCFGFDNFNAVNDAAAQDALRDFDNLFAQYREAAPGTEEDIPF